MFWFQKMLGNFFFLDFWVELEDSKPGFKRVYFHEARP